MRFLLLLVLVAVASVKGATSAAMIQDKDGIASVNTVAVDDQIRRSLRGFVGDNEERGGGAVKLDDAIESFFRQAKDLSLHIDAASLATWEGIEHHVNAVMTHYPTGLSSETTAQLREQEKKRFVDYALFGPAEKDSLLRPMKDAQNPAPVLASHVGRDNQVYADNGGREVVCSVVMRSEREGGGILLISSSKLNNQDFILPKGGLEKNEHFHHAARREVVEEGGVDIEYKADVGIYPVGKKTYRTYLMKHKATYDQWPESRRLRIWVSWDDAIKMLDREHKEMADIVREARAKADDMD